MPASHSKSATSGSSRCPKMVDFASLHPPYARQRGSFVGAPSRRHDARLPDGCCRAPYRKGGLGLAAPSRDELSGSASEPVRFRGVIGSFVEVVSSLPERTGSLREVSSSVRDCASSLVRGVGPPRRGRRFARGAYGPVGGGRQFVPAANQFASGGLRFALAGGATTPGRGSDRPCHGMRPPPMGGLTPCREGREAGGGPASCSFAPVRGPRPAIEDGGLRSAHPTRGARAGGEYGIGGADLRASRRRLWSVAPCRL